MYEQYLVAQQTRPSGWGAFEDTLARQIYAAFEAGHWTLPELVAALRGEELVDRAGEPWTEESLRRELSELGA